MSRYLVYVARRDTGAELTLAVDAGSPSEASDWAAEQGFLVASVEATSPASAEPVVGPPPLRIRSELPHATTRGLSLLASAIVITGAVLALPALLLGTLAVASGFMNLGGNGITVPSLLGAVALGGPLLFAGWLILIPSLAIAAHLRSQAEIIRLARP